MEEARIILKQYKEGRRLSYDAVNSEDNMILFRLIAGIKPQAKDYEILYERVSPRGEITSLASHKASEQSSLDKKMEDLAKDLVLGILGKRKIIIEKVM